MMSIRWRCFLFGYNSKGQIGRKLIDQFEPTKVRDIGPKNPSNTSRWLSALLIQAGKESPKSIAGKNVAYASLGAFHSGILTDEGKIYMGFFRSWTSRYVKLYRFKIY